jgi:hypothetical protein
MTARWQLIDHRQLRGGRYFTIEVDHIRIADVFPDAGMYRGNTDSEWVIEQAQRIVDTMNAAESSEATQ